MMRHWLSIDCLDLHHLSYEDLVADPKGEMGKVSDFLDVEFSEDCLHPERAGGVIQTASNTQARKPISASGLNDWKAYQPCLRELDPYLSDLDWERIIAERGAS